MMYRNEYLLVKVGLNVGEGKWFQYREPLEEFSEETGEETERRFAKRFTNKLSGFLGKGTGGEKRKSVSESMKECAALITGKISEAGSFQNLHSVYAEGLECMTGKGRLSELWGSCWRIPSFAGFGEYRWNRVLIEKPEQADFLLLGVEGCIPEVLERCAGKMKSLRWFPGVCEENEMMEQPVKDMMDNLAEELEEEYGLAVKFEYGLNIRFVADSPICLLEFQHEMMKLYSSPAKGSKWNDFTASKEKRRKLSVYEKEMKYTSLIQYWEGCKRRIVIPDFQNDW